MLLNEGLDLVDGLVVFAASAWRLAPRACRLASAFASIGSLANASSLVALSKILSIKSAAVALASSLPRLAEVFTIQIRSLGENFSRLERLARIFSCRSVTDFSFAAPADCAARSVDSPSARAFLRSFSSPKAKYMIARLTCPRSGPNSTNLAPRVAACSKSPDLQEDLAGPIEDAQRGFVERLVGVLVGCLDDVLHQDQVNRFGRLEVLAFPIDFGEQQLGFAEGFGDGGIVRAGRIEGLDRLLDVVQGQFAVLVAPVLVACQLLLVFFKGRLLFFFGFALLFLGLDPHFVSFNSLLGRFVVEPVLEAHHRQGRGILSRVGIDFLEDLVGLGHFFLAQGQAHQHDPRGVALFLGGP